jgi:hypothetical protein
MELITIFYKEYNTNIWQSLYIDNSFSKEEIENELYSYTTYAIEEWYFGSTIQIGQHYA